MSVLTDILARLPAYWNTEPQGVPVLQILYRGDLCWATVGDDLLELRPVGGSGQHQFYALDTLTLGQLVTAINTHRDEGWSASLITENYAYFAETDAIEPSLNDFRRLLPFIYWNRPAPNWDGRQFAKPGWYWNELGADRPPAPQAGVGLGELGAHILVDTNQDLVVSPRMDGTTSLLWNVLRPLARGVRLAAQDIADDGLRQMDLRGAEGVWLDRWGRLYGTDRNDQENDDNYRRRVANTTFRPRNSPTSIILALENGLGMSNATVIEGWRDTNGGPGDGAIPLFAARVAVTADESVAHLLGTTVRAVLEEYRPAGVKLSQAATFAPTVDLLGPLLDPATLRLSYSDHTMFLTLGDTGYTSVNYPLPVNDGFGDMNMVWGEAVFG